jgi:RNA polymerase sigma-70 factor (ECF subfamily)
MGGFRRLEESKLAGLDDGELIDYALEARAAGDKEQALLALQIFAFGMEDRLRAFVRSRLDSHGDTVIEEVTEKALEQAISSIDSLRGKTAAEARAFVFIIARRRIADFHRSGRGGAETSVGEPGREDAGEVGRDTIGSPTDAVETEIVIEEAMADLRPDHRAVVEQCVFLGYSAREAASEVASRFEGRFDDSMSEQNVHQICSRFRKDLRGRLEAGDRRTAVDG